MRQLAYLFLVCMVVGCTPLSRLSLGNHPADYLTKADYKKLNGVYSNRHHAISGNLKHGPYNGHDEFEGCSILSQLFWNIPGKAYQQYSLDTLQEDEWVSMEFISSKRAIVSLHHNETFIFSKKIHGKFRKGYFYIRPKVFILPLIPLAFGYNFERARIGRSDRDLIMDYSVNRWGFVLVAGSSDRGHVSSAYKSK